MASTNSSDLVNISSSFRRNLKIGLPVFRPENYLNYTGDGSTNDTLAMQVMFTDVSNTGPCHIIIPTTTTICDPGVIKLAHMQSMAGYGLASALKQSSMVGTGLAFIDMSGADGSHEIGKNQISNLALYAGGEGCPAIRAYYNAWSKLTGIFGSGWANFLDTSQFWDYTLDDWQLEYCGGLGASDVAMHFRNSAAPSGFGFSSDTNNQGYVNRVRIEDCFGTAILVEQGPGNTNPPNGITFDFIKIETNVSTGKNLMVFGPGVTNCSARAIYFSANDTAHSRYPAVPDSGAFDMILNQGAGNNTFERIYAHQGTKQLINSVIRHASTGTDTISDVGFSGNSAPVDNVLITVMPGAVTPVIEGANSGSVFNTSTNTSTPVAPINRVGSTKTAANASVQPSERYVRADASGGGFTLQLPTAALCMGQRLILTKVDYNSSNLVTIQPFQSQQSSEVMSDKTTLTLKNWHDTVELIADTDATNGLGVRGWTIVSVIGVSLA